MSSGVTATTIPAIYGEQHRHQNGSDAAADGPIEGTKRDNERKCEKRSEGKGRRMMCLTSLVVLYLAEGINVSATGPFFPIEAMEKGVSQSMVGVISAITMFAMWLTSITLLFLASDRNKRPLFYFGLFTSAATCILFGELQRISDTHLFIASCLATRFLMGVGCACIWATGAPILIPLFPGKAGKIFGLLEFCAGFGQMAGPPFGSLLFSIGGYSLPFWVAGLIEIVAGLFCVVCLSLLDKKQQKIEKKSQVHQSSSKLEASSSVIHGSTRSLQTPKEEQNKVSRTALKFIFHPGIILVSLPVLTIMCEVGFFQVALAPYLLQTFAIDGTSSGNIFLIHAATSAVTCALFGVLVDKGFASVSFIVCTCLTAFGYFLLGLPLLITNSHHSQEITAKLLLYGGLALLGLTANGGFVPVYFLFERIAQLAKIDCQSKIRIYVCTWLNSCYAVGSILGQIVVGGFFFEAFEFYRSCLLLSVLASASFVAGLCYLMHSGLLKRAYDNEDVNETKTEETGQIKVTNLPTEIDA